MAGRINRMLVKNEPVELPRLDNLLALCEYFYMHGIPLDATLHYRSEANDSDTEFYVARVLQVQKTSDGTTVTLGGLM